MGAGESFSLMFFSQSLIQVEAEMTFPPAASVERLSQSFLQAKVAAWSSEAGPLAC